MPKVYTHFERTERAHTPCGDSYLAVFQEEILADGTKGIVKTGQRNVYDMIQEDKESTKIENILAAVAMGDYSVLRSQEPVYIDATTFPKNLMECENIVLKAKNEFNKFPQEVKDLFNNSPDMYVNTMGTPEFLEKMKPYNEKMAKIQELGNQKKYNAEIAKQAKIAKDIEKAKGELTE